MYKPTSWTCAVAVLLLAGPAGAQGYIPAEAWSLEEDWRFDVGLTFSRFEQQVKSEIGGADGERLVEETEFGLALHASYRVWGPFSVGLYLPDPLPRGRVQALLSRSARDPRSSSGGMPAEHAAGEALRAAGATVLHRLEDLPGALRAPRSS